uniref:Uncharacterized protein n=1 Tax=Arundo donax TaxID=35708 RepID=A0A0A8ZZS6_ARUDO
MPSTLKSQAPSPRDACCPLSSSITLGIFGKLVQEISARVILPGEVAKHAVSE